MNTRQHETGQRGVGRTVSLRFWSVILIVVVMLPVVFVVRFLTQLASYDWDYDQYLAEKYVLTNPGVAEISKMTHLGFPPSAELINSRLESWLTKQLYAVVRIDRPDVTSFVASFPQPAEVQSDDRLGITNNMCGEDAAPPWWDPDSARDFVAAVIELPLKFSDEELTDYDITNTVSLLISMDDHQRAIIYLFWVAD